MGSVPVGEDFINAAVRCIRYLFAILYRIFQIGKFILILFQYINHDGTCTYGRVRNDIVLFAAGCPVITAGSDFASPDSIMTSCVSGGTALISSV